MKSGGSTVRAQMPFAAAAVTERRAFRRGILALPLSARLIALTVFLPEEFSFYVGNLRLTPVRVIFLLLAPFVLVRFCKTWAEGRRKIMAPDLFVLLTCIYMFTAVTIVAGLAEAFAHTAPDILEFLVGYFAMRVLLTERGQALTFINLLCSIMALVALLGLLDTASGQYFTHDHLAGLTGYMKTRQHDYRYGLLRATSTLEHPIHLGIVSCFSLILVIGAPVRARGVKIFACACGLIAAISSAPILAALIGLSLLAYDRILAKIPFRWGALTVLVVVGVIFIFITSNNPIGFISEHLILEASSGWYREWEWLTATEALSHSPWFGLAYAWNTIAQQTGAVESIDSLWLATALSFGYPCSILLGLSFISAASCRVRGPKTKTNLTAPEARLSTVLSIIMVLIIFVGFTVDFWAAVWILIALFAGVRAHLSELGTESYSMPSLFPQPTIPVPCQRGRTGL